MARPRPKGMRREAQSIVRRLTKTAQSGLLPDDGMAFGWRGGREPVNAVDTDDDTLMAAWAKDRLCIVVRVDPREETGVPRIDSDVLRQFGLTPKKTGSVTATAKQMHSKRGCRHFAHGGGWPDFSDWRAISHEEEQKAPQYSRSPFRDAVN